MTVVDIPTELRVAFAILNRAVVAHSVETPVSVGELIDRITILEIKAARFTDIAKRANVETELRALCTRRDQAIANSPQLDRLTAELKAVNERLWDLEDSIRECERRAEFGPHFVAVARGIYRSNDERAALKRRISVALGSDLIEEKSYEPY
jgi:hypothetical protein